MFSCHTEVGECILFSNLQIYNYTDIMMTSITVWLLRSRFLDIGILEQLITGTAYYLEQLITGTAVALLIHG